MANDDEDEEEEEDENLLKAKFKMFLIPAFHDNFSMVEILNEVQ